MAESAKAEKGSASEADCVRLIGATGENTKQREEKTERSSFGNANVKQETGLRHGVH